MVNLVPHTEGETISTVMPLPEDEKTWDRYNVMFSTAVGNVRRNLLSDFVNIKANGKIAMKLDEGDALVNVHTCTEADDVLIATRGGMRSEEHTSELQSLMRMSYAVFCLKTKDEIENNQKGDTKQH